MPKRNTRGSFYRPTEGPRAHPNEWIIGRCFSEEEYDASYPGVTIDHLLDVLRFEGFQGDFVMICCGKTGSGGKSSKFAHTVNRTDIQGLSIRMWSESGLARITEYTKNPDNMNAFLYELLGLFEMPIHITGIVVRKP